MFDQPNPPESGPSQRPSEPGSPARKMPWHQGPAATFRHLILTWFGCGLSPWAPGTVGSLGSLPLGVALYWNFGAITLVVCAAILFVAGGLLASAQLRHDGGALEDPQWIVVDEVVGQWIALAALPLSPVSVLIAFVLFRLFDIAKPWPVSWADRRIGGGFGIMLDDLLAGLYAALGGFGALYGFRAIWTRLQ